jgi:Tfp pilus assembly protein PilZ
MTMKLPRTLVPRVETAVTLDSDSNFYVGAGNDVATGGVFVATSRDMAIGQSVLLEIALHSYVLLVRGTIRWRNDEPEDGAPAGVGVGFDDLTSPARWVIERFCARRAPLRRPGSIAESSGVVETLGYMHGAASGA